MSFKKLNSQILYALEINNFEQLLPLQLKALLVIKGGVNIFVQTSRLWKNNYYYAKIEMYRRRRYTSCINFSQN